jgi:hypothetical protein
VSNTNGFYLLLSYFLPGNQEGTQAVRSCIQQRYLTNPNDQKTAAIAMIQDSQFTCNPRWTLDAMHAKSKPVYLMDYAFWASKGAAVHASDLFPTFWSSTANVTTVATALALQLGKSETIIAALLSQVKRMYTYYQSYFVNFAINGDPNKGGSIPATWNLPSPQPTLSSVMQVSGNLLSPAQGFDNSYTDDEDTESTCGFWNEMASAVVESRAPTISCTPTAAATPAVNSDKSDYPGEL